MISKGLKAWFKAHFIVDMITGIPLLFTPAWTLSLLSLPSETITARLVGAALLGIGGASIFTKTKDQFSIMLKLKRIWSTAAILALLLALIGGAPLTLWIFVAVFAVFAAVWWYYTL